MKNINTVGSTIYQNIKKDIIFGKLAPSSKLKLDKMKLNYPASMSTLRETLNRLSSEGFVLAEEQRGFFVAPVTHEDLKEIADLRILLECHALKLSVENGNTDWEGNLVAAHHKLHLLEKEMLSGNTANKEEWKRYDWEFHLALISECGSKNLITLHSLLYDKYLRYQMLVLTYRGGEAVQEHKDIFEAALQRNATLATKVLKQHIIKGLEHTLEGYEFE